MGLSDFAFPPPPFHCWKRYVRFEQPLSEFPTIIIYLSKQFNFDIINSDYYSTVRIFWLQGRRRRLVWLVFKLTNLYVTATILR